MAARAALAVFAALLTAALAVQLRAHDLSASAQAALSLARPSPAQLDAALRDARRAADVLPGGGSLLLEAGLAQRAGRSTVAARAATQATRREPENFAAWVTLGVARQAGGDAAGARRAFARAKALNPLYSTPR